MSAAAARTAHAARVWEDRLCQRFALPEATPLFPSGGFTCSWLLGASSALATCRVTRLSDSEVSLGDALQCDSDCCHLLADCVVPRSHKLDLQFFKIDGR